MDVTTCASGAEDGRGDGAGRQRPCALVPALPDVPCGARRSLLMPVQQGCTARRAPYPAASTLTRRDAFHPQAYDAAGSLCAPAN
jgi:hypothetical protein